MRVNTQGSHLESRAAVAVGTLTNLTIGAAKMLVGSVGGSSAMLAEGIHSLVDTADQLVMFRALHRDRRSADGHTSLDGRKAHYWSLVISMVV
jgi:divalent metal cation (Fe/Co/Zn/Cd) transporter